MRASHHAAPPPSGLHTSVAVNRSVAVVLREARARVRDPVDAATGGARIHIATGSATRAPASNDPRSAERCGVLETGHGVLRAERILSFRQPAVERSVDAVRDSGASRDRHAWPR